MGQSRPNTFLWVTVTSVVLAVGCTGSTAPRTQPSGGGTEPSTPRAPTTITIGITSGVQAMGIMGAPTTSGGWQSLNEVHSNGLITSEANNRQPTGQLAEKTPSLEDGSVSVLPDGRMRVVYKLRPGVTWQDGVKFTAQDLMFSFQLNADQGVPSIQRDAINRIESVEASDDLTFVMYFKSPYYRGPTLGVRLFWPQPQHILGPAYERYLASKNPEDVINFPYWTSEYVHLGPFKMTNYDPAEGMSFQAYDGYFRGKPKVDIIKIRTFSDQNTMFSNLLAGTVDMFPDIALSSELGYQLKDRWDADKHGTVHVKLGITWFLAPQFRPAIQSEPANLDPKVRAGLYQALDREALSDGLQNGHPELAAWSFLPPGDRYYDAVKDQLRQFAFNPERAKAILRDAGWTPGGDGLLRHSSDGRRFHNSLWTTPGRDREVAAYASYWRQIGIEVDEFSVPAAQVRSLEYRASFPSWEGTAQGAGDAIFGRFDGPPASAATRWVGERGGFEDARADQLILNYRTSLTGPEQMQGMKAFGDYFTENLPLLILYYLPDHVGVRKGIKAFDDVDGGAEGAQPYGTYSRNAHLWEVL